MSIERFTYLMGTVIHQCGTLEFHINFAIELCSTDPLLCQEIIGLSFGRRIKVLRRLLKERTKLPHAEIDSLCAELAAISDERNLVAHSPILVDEADSPTHVIGVRQLTDFLDPETFFRRKVSPRCATEFEKL